MEYNGEESCTCRRLVGYKRSSGQYSIPYVDEEYVNCGGCETQTTVREAFDAAYRSWPTQLWIAYRCPACGTTNHLEVRTNRIIEGYLDGAPAPCLIAARDIRISDMSVKRMNAGVVIKNLNLGWFVPVRVSVDSLGAALAASRSIIALNAPWLAHAQRVVATLELAFKHIGYLGITFAVVDEESNDVRAWLKENAPEELRGDFPGGAGSLFWLEDGTVVDCEIAGGNLTLVELLRRTRDRWEPKRPS